LVVELFHRGLPARPKENLKALSADFGQGYFFFKSVDSEQADNLLQKQAQTDRPTKSL
jgi:hypothetical protein